MIESFENSKRIVAVGRESIGLRADFILKSELREFQAEYFDGGVPSVRVAINAKLVQMPRRSIMRWGSAMRSKSAAAASR